MPNYLRCMMCGEVLSSLHRHDFQQCTCLNMAFIDGGDEYLRFGALDMGSVQLEDEYGNKLAVSGGGSLINNHGAEGFDTAQSVALGEREAEFAPDHRGDDGFPGGDTGSTSWEPPILPLKFKAAVLATILKHEGYPHTTERELTKLMKSALCELGFHEGISYISVATGWE